MHSAIFLDRDGVIIENCPNYVRSWDDVFIFPEALEALAALAQQGGEEPMVVIITNQSAVGRGIMSLRQVEEINARLVQEIEKAGGRVDGVFVCPHAPEDGCTCRKPLPGLLQEAARKLDLDLARSVMIGDAVSDLQAGQAAGVRKTALVCTGRGPDQLSQAQQAQLKPYSVYKNLAEALVELLPEIRQGGNGLPG